MSCCAERSVGSITPRREVTTREQIDPEFGRTVRWFPPMVFSPLVTRLMRRLPARLAGRVDLTGVAVTDRSIPNGQRARIYRPEHTRGPLPVVLWIHGGGFVVGDHIQDVWARHLLSRLAVVVVSAGYRLAPEHPFPAALDDLTAAWDWITTEGAEHGMDPTRIAVAGESAGGGLAAALIQRLTDEGRPPRAQILVYPMLDDRTAVRSDIARKAHPVWNNGSNHFGWKSYLGAEPGSATVSDHAVPARRSDLAELPPAWIGVGDLDLFLDEDTAYAERLRLAGVPCQLERLAGAPHGFASMAPEAAPTKAFIESATQFLERHL